MSWELGNTLNCWFIFPIIGVVLQSSNSSPVLSKVASTSLRKFN